MKRITSNSIRSFNDIRDHKRAVRKEMRETRGRIQHYLEHYLAEWAVTRSVSKSIFTVMSLLGGNKHKFIKRIIAYGGTIASRTAIKNWFTEHQREDMKERFKKTAENARLRTMEAVYKGSQPVLSFLQRVVGKKRANS